MMMVQNWRIMTTRLNVCNLPAMERVEASSIQINYYAVNGGIGWYCDGNSVHFRTNCDNQGYGVIIIST